MHPNAHAYTRLNRNVCFLGLLIGLASLQVSQKLIFVIDYQKLLTLLFEWQLLFFLGIQIQMSTSERKNLLDYLPPQQKQKILTLIQRLKEQTEAKEKYLALYNNSQRTVAQLTSKCDKLKDENSYLKQQIHNSFSMVSQVRATFKANKEKLSTQKEKGQAEDQWEDDSDQQSQQAKQQSHQNVQVSHPPRPNKSPLENYRPQQTSSKKFNNILNLSTTDHNITSLSASKGKQLQELRKEVRTLQDSKKKTYQKSREYDQKRRLVDQIKNRYKSGENYTQIGTKNQHQQSHIQKIDISETFENQAQFSETISPKKVEVIKKSQRKQQKPMKSVAAKPETTLYENNQRKSKMVTNQDYGDVLQMINSYNL